MQTKNKQRDQTVDGFITSYTYGLYIQGFCEARLVYACHSVTLRWCRLLIWTLWQP